MGSTGDEGCSECCGGSTYCYKYEDQGPKMYELPKTAFKRNGLQDNVYSPFGNVRYICQASVKPCCCDLQKCRKNIDQPRQKKMMHSNEYSTAYDQINQCTNDCNGPRCQQDQRMAQDNCCGDCPKYNNRESQTTDAYDNPGRREIDVVCLNFKTKKDRPATTNCPNCKDPCIAPCSKPCE